MSAEQTTRGAESGTPPPEPAPAAADPAGDAAGRGPGARLRAARESRQLGVQQVTDLLHIEPRLIEAMEADDFTAFDAPVYARGFLRKYAAFLEVPGDEIVAGYERLHGGPGAPSLIPPATAEVPRRDWSVLKVPLAIAVVLLLVGGSYWWWLTRTPATGTESAPPAVAAPAATTPVQAPVAPPGETTASAVQGGLAASSAVEPTPAGAPTPPAVSGVAFPATAQPAGAGAPPPTLPSGAALEIDFLGDCWVEVTGPNGERLMYDLGVAGQSRALPGPGPWRVFLGAADAARLRVGGRPVQVPAASRSGATARLVVGPDGTVR